MKGRLKIQWNTLRQVNDLYSALVTCLMGVARQTTLQYRPLETPTTIRIAEIQQGYLDDPIKIQLLHIDYREYQYEALSYEWGVGSANDPYILVDGRRNGIQRNLYEALLQLRFHDKDRHIWVDALSIQQEVATERNHQVQLMGDIYRWAWSVIIWLGPARDNSDAAMDILARKVTSKTHSDGAIQTTGHQSTKTGYTALIALYERSYWRRIWIQQEVYLAQTIALHCGSKTLPNFTFLGLLRHARFGEKRGQLRKTAAYTLLQRRHAAFAANSTLDLWLLENLYSNLQASEPRDYIYAMLGISSDCQNGEILPDYEKTVQDVYVEAVVFCADGARPQFLFDLARKMGVPFNQELRHRLVQIDALDVGVRRLLQCAEVWTTSLPSRA
jgi:hypothetical protein